jgi:predicted Fe-Mo cluster-binding NifX family protein
VKIAIVSDDKNTISHHFGRALGVIVFEIDKDKVLSEEYRENVGKNKGECGSCDHEAMIKNVKDCSHVISYGMGQRIYNDLLAHNIIAVVTEEKTVKDALSKFMNNSLKNRTDKLH